MTHNFRTSTGIQSSANIILTCSACPDAHLHMIIHGFAFGKIAKPAHEHHLQVSQRSQTWLTPIYQDLKKATPPNGLKKVLMSGFMTTLLALTNKNMSMITDTHIINLILK